MQRQISALTVWTVLVGLGVVWANTGCSRTEATPVEKDLGKLPWLRHTNDEELAATLARIEEQQGTPEQLESDWPEDSQNVAVGLTEIFKPGTLKRALRRSEELMPVGPFIFDAVELVPVKQFRAGHEFQRRKVTEALRRETCRFKIEYTDGLLADTSPLDAVRLAVRLENFRVAEILADGRPADAVDPLEIGFHLIDRIAAEQHVAYRLEAAALREESLRVLAAIAQHPQTSPQVLRWLGRVLAEQLTSWPDDSRAWVGDRAIGLHAYEMVRDGQILSLLTEEEYKAAIEDETLMHLPVALRANGVLDRDQQYYLDTMQRIIDASKNPYYERKKLFMTIRQELDEAKRSGEFRYVSARILLPEIQRLHRMQARDRARCEAWTLAIAKAVAAPLPEIDRNPLTGKPYHIHVESHAGQPTRVVVTGIGESVDDDEPVVVPIPSSLVPAN